MPLMSLPAASGFKAGEPVTALGRAATKISKALVWLETAAILLSATGMAGVLVLAMTGSVLLGRGIKLIDGETLGHLPEYAMFLMVWVGGFGASAAVRQRMHLTLGAALKTVWLRKIQELVCLGICAGLTWVLYLYLRDQSEMMLFHKRMAMLGLTASGGLMSLRYLLLVLGAEPPAALKETPVMEPPA